jgi:hypothetical protein
LNEVSGVRYDDNGKKTISPRTTFRRSGIVIHEEQRLTHATPRRNKGPGATRKVRRPDALCLPGHGNLVGYGNIWVVETAVSQ